MVSKYSHYKTMEIDHQNALIVASVPTLFYFLLGGPKTNFCIQIMKHLAAEQHDYFRLECYQDGVKVVILRCRAVFFAVLC